MSKRASKARANRRQGTAEKSKAAVAPEAEGLVSAEIPKAEKLEKPSEAPAVSQPVAVVPKSEKPRTPVSLQSMIPPTDDIDSDWGDLASDEPSVTPAPFNMPENPVFESATAGLKASGIAAGNAEPSALSPARETPQSSSEPDSDVGNASAHHTSVAPASRRIHNSTRPFGLSDVPVRPSTPPNSTTPAGLAQTDSISRPSRSETPTETFSPVRESPASEMRSTTPPPRTSLTPRSVTPISRAYTPGIRDTHPSTPVARAKAQSIDTEVEAKRVGGSNTMKPALGEKSSTSSSASRDAPTKREINVEARGSAANRESAAPPRTAAESTAAAPQSAAPIAASASKTAQGTKLPPIPVLVTLWAITAAIPALVVWAVMRNPARVVVHEAPRTEVRAVANSPEVRPPTQPAAESAAVSEGPNPVSSASSDVSSPAPSGSASVPESTTPVFVDTESADRVSVLIKSKPKTAKVYKRAKEIGRTPLIVQIGRGERRVFDVGTNLGTTKRISIDGEKPEITVTLMIPKPAASVAPVTE